MNKAKKHIVQSAAFSAMLVVLLFALVSCGRDTVKVVSVSDMAGTAVQADKSEALCTSTIDFTRLKKISKSNMVEMYFDESTFSVSVVNTDTNKVWCSLPLSYNSKAQTIPSVLSVKVLAGEKTYTLNSQLNSVAAGLAEYSSEEGKISVKYGFTVTSDDESLAFSIPVVYTLTDGSLFVNIDCSKITCDKKLSILEIKLLDYFASNSATNDGDYILVPDGSGAIIYPARIKDKLSPVELKVYGNNAAISDVTANAALVGSFGFKQGANAFVAVIEEGDAIATVYADVADNTGYNTVCAGFEITSTYYNEKSGKLYRAAESYDGSISLCYRFLSSNNANYSAMASACREQLIRSGILSSTVLDSSATLPAVITLDGAVKSDSTSGTTTLTTFEQAQDLLTLIKAKGFSNIFTRYCGIFSGGINQADIDGLKPMRALGGEEAFKELTDYMTAQQLELYIDVNLLSAAKGNYSSGKKAIGINRSGINYNLISDSLTTGKQIIFEKNLLRLNKLEDTVIDVLTSTREMDIAGYSLNDAGSLLYSDYTKGSAFNRQQAKEHIAEQSESLVTGKKLMVDNGNVYMLKNALIVNSIPFSACAQENSAYVSVPFVQMIIHGMMYYSCSPLNLEKNSEIALLKCIEYGAVPSFEWYYSNIAFSNEKGVSENNYHYANWANKAYALYKKANEALSGISDSRITNHYAVQSGVYCTEYNDTQIYVNYTDSNVEINGTTVEALSFLRIN